MKITVEIEVTHHALDMYPPLTLATVLHHELQAALNANSRVSLNDLIQTAEVLEVHLPEPEPELNLNLNLN